MLQGSDGASTSAGNRIISCLCLPGSASASGSDHGRFLLGSIGCFIETGVVFV